MCGIHVFNITKEEHLDDNSFYCGRGSILGNPYTHIKDKETKARFIVKDREEAIDRYGSYFDVMYGSNMDFTAVVDEIYEKYKSGEDVWLGCYCKPLSCHCDVIVDRLRKRLLKEKVEEIRLRKVVAKRSENE